MKLGHSGHQTQPEPAARRTARVIEALEALQYSLTVRLRDTWSGIGYRYAGGPLTAFYFELDDAAAGSVFNCIIEQIADCLRWA